jgi:hypothetical protein
MTNEKSAETNVVAEFISASARSNIDGVGGDKPRPYDNR